jgi:hypothetical protein
VSGGSVRTVQPGCSPLPYLYWSPDGHAAVFACAALAGFSEQAVLVSMH